MKRKIEYGTIELNKESFDDDDAFLRVSMMLPLNMIKDLKKLSLTEKHG